jgi:hypothetical protein
MPHPWGRLSSVFLRCALGLGFLSAAARFGLWGAFGQHNVEWGHFARFRNTREVLVASLVACCATASPGYAVAQTTMEARGSNSQYRFVDVSHAFKNNVVFDALYIGVPESNEVFVGAGYQLKPAKWLTISPL